MQWAILHDKGWVPPLDFVHGRFLLRRGAHPDSLMLETGTQVGSAPRSPRAISADCEKDRTLRTPATFKGLLSASKVLVGADNKCT